MAIHDIAIVQQLTHFTSQRSEGNLEPSIAEGEADQGIIVENR